MHLVGKILANIMIFIYLNSIRYLGLDWNANRILLRGLLAHVNEVCQNVLDTGPDETSVMSLLMPSNLVRDLTKIQEDLISHAEAVLSGRISKKGMEFMR